MLQRAATRALASRKEREPEGARSLVPALARPLNARERSRPLAPRLLLSSALVVLATAIVVACLPLRAAAQEPHRAGLVIRFDDGRIETRCIAIEADGSTGVDLLAQSGLAVIMDASSGMGITVCQIEELGCPYPARPCFCRCMSGSECGYWNYYYRESGQFDWTYSPLGAKLRQLQHGVVEAWVWGDGRVPPPDELTFEAICAPPAATPPPTLGPEGGSQQERPAPTGTSRPPLLSLGGATPTADAATEEPAAPVASATPGQVAPGTPVMAATASPRTTQGTGPTLASYWPFGLMVLVLAAIAVGLRRRRTGGA